MTDSIGIMKTCMQTNTYDGCDIKKCRDCAAKRECDKKTWESLGGK